MREKLQIYDVKTISDGKGGKLDAKIVPYDKKHDLMPYELRIQTRRQVKNARWSKSKVMKRRAFWMAHDAAL